MTQTHPDPRAELVGDVRHSPVVSIRGSDSLWDAWHVMFVSGLRHLVVVDDGGSIIGMITDRALLNDLPLTEHHLSERCVSEVMVSPGSVTDRDTAHSAAARMTLFAVDALPIADEAGRLAGLITASDLAAWVADS